MNVRPLLLLVLLTSAACTTIVPPQDVEDPVAVYLVTDNLLHAAVAFPHGDGRYVEYSIGDWDYVMGNGNLVFDGPRVLLYSPKLGVGRRFFANESMVGQQDWWKPGSPRHNVYMFFAEREKVEATRAAWEERYFNAKGTPVVEPSSGITYRVDPGQYHTFNNCNHVTVRTLKSLGADIHGFVLVASYNMAAQKLPEKVKADRSLLEGKPSSEIYHYNFIE